jgi:hypothetical protein
VLSSHNQTYARWTWEKKSPTGHGRQLGWIEAEAEAENRRWQIEEGRAENSNQILGNTK